MTGPSTSPHRGVKLSAVAKSWKSSDRRFELFVAEVALEAGEIALLSGPNGTGKTTLLELLGLAAKPDSGRIVLTKETGEETDVSAIWEANGLRRLAALRAETFGYVLQSTHLLPFLTVRQNAELMQSLAGRPDPELLDRLFETLGLEDRQASLPAALSPGLRQRAAVARALAHRPRIVVADEPTAALDPLAGDAVLDLLLSLAREEGAATIISTHQRSQMSLEGVRSIVTRQVPTDDPTLIQAVVDCEV